MHFLKTSKILNGVVENTQLFKLKDNLKEDLRVELLGQCMNLSHN
jgi:hypothetical protein